jgi:thiol-disulfide isomerase/thioredoxin
MGPTRFLSLLPLLATCLLLSMGRAETQAAEPPPLDGQMARFQWHDAPVPVTDTGFAAPDGTVLTLTSFPGQVLLVNFWATWCAPCVEEMPHLNALQQDAGSPRFQVLTISQDREGTAKAQGFLDKHGLAALQAHTDARWDLGRALKLRGLPTTLLIDAEGRELGRFEGPADWAGPEARALIDWAVEHAGDS